MENFNKTFKGLVLPLTIVLIFSVLFLCFKENENAFTSSASLEDYIETNTFYDGTSMTSSKVDGFIYIKQGSKYYVYKDYYQGKSISAKLFRVKADGKNDDSEALQTAIEISSLYGILLQLPAGQINISKEIKLDTGKKKNSIRVVGSGVSLTIIKVLSNTNGLVVDGSYFNNLDLRDFRIETDLAEAIPSAKTGLLIRKQVYASLENIEAIGFNTGIIVNDVSTLYMKGVNARFCGIGLYMGRMEKSDINNPNLLEMHTCVYNSNKEWGVKIENGHSVNFYNCLFEDNNQGAINMSFNATNGGVGINVNGCYFEGNSGFDINLFGSAGGVHNFIGNTFNRVSKEKYTVNNININLPYTDNNPTLINLIGNAFFTANTYVSSGDRKTINITSSNPSVVQINDFNQYRNYIDRPSYNKKMKINKVD